MVKKRTNKTTKKQRPDWDNYFLELANLVSKRSTCLRRNVGAVVVKNKHILATGYNGAPKNITHCEEVGCLRESMKIPSGQRHELCLLPDEDVVTSKGYAPINQIKVGQRVLTHKGFYRRVIRRPGFYSKTRHNGSAVRVVFYLPKD